MAREDMLIDEGATFGRRRTSTSTVPITQEELAAENARFDPITGMDLENLKSDIPEIRQSFTMPGFTPGPFPQAFEKFFGPADPNMLGYKIVSNSDGSQQLEVQTGPGSTSTFGAPIKVGADGTVSTFTKTTTTATNTATNTISAALQLQIDNLIEQGRIAEARRLEDKARFDAEIKSQAAASKLAYDTAAKDKADAIKVERVSAYQTLKTEFEKYGLGSLVESVEALILNGTPKSQATLKLRATPQYQLRFAGNTQRLASGKNLYDESTYLALENDFQASFEAYGQKALLGKTRESAQAMFADYIGSDKSPDEIKNRIRLAVDEVSSRKDIRSEFQKYFPEITDTDLVSYFLKPKETLTALTAKVRVAQIGSAASAQGLNASLTTATDLEQLGLTEQQARTGYQRVATDLPTIEKLGNIDKTSIGQTTAENAYLKGLASEQRKIDKAAERERNRYAQSSGMNKVSLTDAKAAGQY
jgi:hypothetical protein